ncbi:MAG: hypothetical protein LBN24_09630, partial [Mediterranea sp.]|nr:hypothetical protein [Mediterranea sp.]
WFIVRMPVRHFVHIFTHKLVYTLIIFACAGKNTKINKELEEKEDLSLTFAATNSFITLN